MQEGASGPGAKLWPVGRRYLPWLLVVLAAAADLGGNHGLALDALLASVPFAAVASICAFGEYLDRRGSAAVALHALLGAGVLTLLVLSCALRSGVESTPPLAVSTLVAALVLVGIKGAVAAAPYVRRLADLLPAKP